MIKLWWAIRWKLITGPLGRLVQEMAHRPRVISMERAGHKRVLLGEGVVLNDAVLNVGSGLIRIGDQSFLGTGVSLLTGTHDIRQFREARQSATPPEGRDIVIGKGVWISSNSTVIGPCVIGDDAVVAAGAVVTHDVPALAIVAGVPAKVIGTVDHPADH